MAVWPIDPGCCGGRVWSRVSGAEVRVGGVCPSLGVWRWWGSYSRWPLVRGWARRSISSKSVSANPPAQVRAGGSFRVVDVVVNRGSARAPKSVTRFFLRAGKASLLAGSRRVPRLKPHGSSRAAVLLSVPRSAPCGRLLARGVRRRRPGRRGAKRAQQLPYGAPACHRARRGGRRVPSPPRRPRRPRPRAGTVWTPTATALPTAPTAPPRTRASIRARPTSPTSRSSTPTATGSTAPQPMRSSSPRTATTRTRAPRTSQCGRSRPPCLAGRNSRKDVYVAAGSYAHVAAETGVGDLRRLRPEDLVARRAATRRSITGSPEAILLDDRKGVVHSARQRQRKPRSRATANVYGIRAVNGSSLTLQDVTVTAGRRSRGLSGCRRVRGRGRRCRRRRRGGSCDSTTHLPLGGRAGSSPAGRLGGRGGDGGVAELGSHYPGQGGGPGQVGAPGGAGGENGNPGHCGSERAERIERRPGSSGPGGANATAERRVVRPDQDCPAQTASPVTAVAAVAAAAPSQASSPRTETETAAAAAAAALAAAGAVRAAAEGGGSFGVYLFNSTVTVESSSITSGNGGAGGRGGDGGTGGIRRRRWERRNDVRDRDRRRAATAARRQRRRRRRRRRRSGRPERRHLQGRHVDRHGDGLDDQGRHRGSGRCRWRRRLGTPGDGRRTASRRTSTRSSDSNEEGDDLRAGQVNEQDCDPSLATAGARDPRRRDLDRSRSRRPAGGSLRIVPLPCTARSASPAPRSAAARGN